ncbi:MAG TPA: hypothetical protein DDX19_03310 [Rhodopirellula baltica]|uniref:Secreted protein n=2 Tax=Rhodopirellula baltica TaxID=265606 RepID=F2AUQ0_RHOBT|nr:hypothetical protein [Rhodopirellula baltica]EGF26616.1 hypothetical protein RBWH47_02988 [Rhodopirellula baltica WH47]ELP33413.1 hypothetical protein RBSWK_02678 [Rhodopirellula baltica SWK14]HBE61798.1 hypothetical protein [Rhodopirellula baltica]
MYRSFAFCLFLSLGCIAMIGCGSGGEAEYDPSEVPAMTEDEKQAQADYDAQMEKEFQEQYGN